MYRKSLEYDGMCFFLGFTPEGHFPQSGVASYSSTFYLKNKKRQKLANLAPTTLEYVCFWYPIPLWSTLGLWSAIVSPYVRPTLECDGEPVCDTKNCHFGVPW